MSVCVVLCRVCVWVWCMVYGVWYVRICVCGVWRSLARMCLRCGCEYVCVQSPELVVSAWVYLALWGVVLSMFAARGHHITYLHPTPSCPEFPPPLSVPPSCHRTWIPEYPLTHKETRTLSTETSHIAMEGSCLCMIIFLSGI